MGIPLMIQEEDNRKIERLKKDMGANKKIAVVRAGLLLLEKELKRQRWKHAAALAAKSSMEINKLFQPHVRIKSK